MYNYEILDTAENNNKSFHLKFNYKVENRECVMTGYLCICFFKDNGTIMDGDTDGDGAINLSTSQRPSAANTPNGSIDFEDSGQVSNIFKCFFTPSSSLLLFC